MIRSILMSGILAVFLFAGNAKAQTTVLPTSFIPIDSANKMIGSYITSLGANVNDSNLRSWFINMDQINLYNSSATDSNKIIKLEIKLAHNLDYINSGHNGQNAGYKNAALTLILVGLKASGNYVYFNNGLVIDHSAVCPPNCPPGAASSPYLTN